MDLLRPLHRPLNARDDNTNVELAPHWSPKPVFAPNPTIGDFWVMWIASGLPATLGGTAEGLRFLARRII
jgi:hypothetical protein